ncbi:MAG TPA: PQQ-binding-like beta-propeller repeat protein, partial [Anaerolineae bacterium]|nr:PQQ-binding-like beta-propeller repeat protein [Anaerolineae bacterium]
MIFTIFIFGQEVFSEDWTMWRYDAGRTAASPGELPDMLHLLWIRQYRQRTMVWDDPLNQDLMPYDRVFEPVVMGKTMFIGFNDSDKVVALDTDTGREKWTFYVDGPVRFPSVAWNGKVYFTSDDGYLYCVSAQNGELLWKIRGGPSDRKILGNRRFISTWPARGGPVIEDGIVYFTASIWPFMGIFIYAVDAETGRIIWKNDGTGSHYMLQPHDAPSFAGVAPQGALVVAGDKLLVPGGRSVPACFNRHTGEFLYYELAANNKTGGSFVCALDDVFFNHHRERVTTMYDVQTGKALIRNIGNYPVLTKETRYFSGKSVTALKSGWIKANMEKWNKNFPDPKELRRLFMKKLKEKLLWNLTVDASGDLIKAGNRLYAAGGQQITVIDLGNGISEPKIALTISVEGTIERLVAADNKLFAVTLDGQIMAFGARKTKPLQILSRSFVKESSTKMNKEAVEILDQTGVTDGYALFYGVGDGDLLEALVRNSELHIIAVDPNEKKVLEMRRRFDLSGFYGERVSILRGDPFSLQAPPYMASLTIFHELDLSKYKLDETFLNRIYTPMRPYGGITRLPLEGKRRDS